MTNLIIAYVLIAVLLTAYGLSVYVRGRRVGAELRALENGEAER